MQYSKTQGFSLVELSVVLVILGIVVGGILSGKTLIRAAELRAISTELQHYESAAHQFQQLYETLPGDLTNATEFWGDNITHCSDVTVDDGSPGTCNGNSSERLDWGSAASEEGEFFLFWNHLALAGFIEGTYTGIAGSGSSVHGIVDENIPRSKYPNGAWAVMYQNPSYAGSGEEFALDFSNHFVFGVEGAWWLPNNPILSPDDAWKIDKKIDDGLPAKGRMIARYYTTCAALADGSTPTRTSFNAVYNVDNTDIGCALMFRGLL